MKRKPNQLDSRGRRNGFWKYYFPDGKIFCEPYFLGIR